MPHVKNPWKTCLAEGMCALNSHMIKTSYTLCLVNKQFNETHSRNCIKLARGLFA